MYDLVYQPMGKGQSPYFTDKAKHYYQRHAEYKLFLHSFKQIKILI